MKSSSSRFRFISTCTSSALTTISHRPRHMCQAMTSASGSPRPLAPYIKQYTTSFHCALPGSRLPLHHTYRAPAVRAYVWVPILSQGVMRGHACPCRRASGEGKWTFTHACISGNPLSPMLNKLNMCCFLFLSWRAFIHSDPEASSSRVRAGTESWKTRTNPEVTSCRWEVTDNVDTNYNCRALLDVAGGWVAVYYP